MATSILILSLVLKINATTRIDALIEIIIYTLFGGAIYLFLAIKSGLVKDILGNKLKTHV